MIMSLICLLALNVQAEVYKPHTSVPVELQDEVLAAVYQKFPCIQNLQEVSTTETIDRIDQGIIDRHYLIQFLVPSVASNGQDTLIISAKASLYAFQNGKNTQVHDVQSTWGDNICP